MGMLSIALLVCVKRVIYNAHKGIFKKENGVIDPIISLSIKKG
jgi:hypothetical protein